MDRNALAVRASGLTKAFGEGEPVLRGVDLEIAQGELTMLVGPSGCGKTTLLCVLAGLLEPGEGEVELFGHTLSRLGAREQVAFRRRNLGFVFQQFNLLPALSAAENAAVPLLAGGVRRNEAVERARVLLAELGLGERTEAFPRQLSGGQQQRVALARAVIHEPRLIVCDEPTSALDAQSGHRVMELLTAVSVRPERAVIVVTHDARIFSFADAIAHMEDGKITHMERPGASAADTSHVLEGAGI